MPRIIRDFLDDKLGFGLTTVLKSAEECGLQKDPKDKEWLAQYTAKITNCLLTKHPSYLYFIETAVIKSLYICICVGQLIFINHYLENWSSMFVPQSVAAILKQEERDISRSFPTVFLCDFSVRRLGNLQNYTVQCTIAFNKINEMLLIFLWMWITILCIYNCLHLFFWIVTSIIPFFGDRYIISRLGAVTGEPDSQSMTDFSRRHIGTDGYLMLQLVGTTGGEEVVAKVLKILYDEHGSSKPQPRQEQTSSTKHTILPI